MKKKTIRALRNRDFFLSLSQEERARLRNPAGMIDVRDEDVMSSALGGEITQWEESCDHTCVSCFSTGSQCCCL